MATVRIPSHGVDLNAVMYIASGAGPHPVVILLNGHPGYERNLDLAQAIRRDGWNVLTFDYRGSWGTPGSYSLAHCAEDTAAAISFLRHGGYAAQLRIDPARIVLLGHSTGGLLAAYDAASDRSVIAVGLISAAHLEAMGSADRLAGRLASRPVLLITAEDGFSQEGLEFADALRRHGDRSVTEERFAADHVYSAKRIALAATILKWLGTLDAGGR